MTRSLLLRRGAARLVDLVLILLVTAAVALLLNASSSNVRADGSYVGFPTGDPVVVVGLATSTLAVWAALLWRSALSSGRTPGRMLLRLRVTGADGADAAPVVLLGRELLRAGSIGIGLALSQSAASAVVNTVQVVSTNVNLSYVAAIGGFLPLTVTLALIAGVIATDPDGRGLHDRIAGTRVTAA